MTTAGNARVFHGDAAAAYQAGLADGAAAERDRIAVHVQELRAITQNLAAKLPHGDPMRTGLEAQDEVLFSLLHLIGDN